MFSTKRASKRREFDEKQKEKEIVLSRIKKEFEEERQKNDEIELYNFRKSLETKARPIPNFNSPFQPKLSEKCPTQPLSPDLETKKRKLN